MLASEFDFDLPDDLIAQHPIEPRDRARLMVIDRRQGCWEHRTFAELPELLASSRHPGTEQHAGCAGAVARPPRGDRR